MFYVAIRLWNRGMLTVGDFVLIQTYLLQLMSRLWMFGRIVRDLYRYLADAQEMVEVLTLPHQVMDKLRAQPLTVPRGKIAFEGVNFDYAETRTIIKKFSLNIAPGEKVGLVAFWLYKNIALSAVMVSAVTLNLLLAAVMGVTIPIVMHKLGRDPAVGSSVLITAVTDSCGFFIFLGLATLFLL